MITPRTLNSAISQGYIITKISFPGSADCLVKLSPKFYKDGMKAVISFWKTSKYIRNRYPASFDRCARF